MSLYLSMLLPGMASANIILLGSDDFEALNDGAYVDGTNATVPGSFNQEIMTLGNETLSGDVLISDIPYFDITSSLYFEFIYDMQENGVSQTFLSIDDLVVSVGATTIWDYDEETFGSIWLNSTTDETNTPLGNGGDMALYVPVALFNSLGFTGSDTLTLTVTQSSSGDGTDEWIVQGSGTFFGPGDPIIDPGPVVPVPAAIWLFGSGLLGLVGIARRKKTT